MKIAAIVEGHGDEPALRILLRRLAERKGAVVELLRPIRQSRGRLVKRAEFVRAIDLAAKQTRQGDGILVLLDADEDCPAELAPRMLAWARQARADRQIAVVLAKREFEAWFLGAAESIAGTRGLARGTKSPLDPEAIRGAKGWLSERMGRRYSETIDQPAFAATFDLDAARRCDSFDKLVRDVERLLAGGCHAARTAP